MTTLTDWELSEINRLADSGMGFRPACEEIKRAPRTVIADLKARGIHDEIRATFARNSRVTERTDGTIAVFSLDAIRKQPPKLPPTPQAKWLAQPWRQSA